MTTHSDKWATMDPNDFARGEPPVGIQNWRYNFEGRTISFSDPVLEVVIERKVDSSNSSVYLAHDAEQTDLAFKPVLVNCLEADLEKPQIAEIRKTYNKLKALTHLRHPNVMQYIAAAILTDNLSGIHVLVVSEFCQVADNDRAFSTCSSGKHVSSLYKLGLERGRSGLSTLEACALTQDMLHGLEYLHGLPIPIAHLDMKPQNILLYTDQSRKDRLHAKIADIDDHLYLMSSKTVTGDLQHKTGTLKFASPELLAYLADENPTKHRIGRLSDIWSLGKILQWCLKPEAQELADEMKQEAKMETGGAPVTLQHFIALCLMKNQADRPTATVLLRHFLFDIFSKSKPVEEDLTSLMKTCRCVSAGGRSLTLFYTIDGQCLYTCPCGKECFTVYDNQRNHSTLYVLKQGLNFLEYEGQESDEKEQKGYRQTAVRLLEECLVFEHTDTAKKPHPVPQGILVEDGMFLCSYGPFRNGYRFPWRMIRNILYQVAAEMSSSPVAELNPYTLVLSGSLGRTYKNVSLCSLLSDVLRNRESHQSSHGSVSTEAERLLSMLMLQLITGLDIFKTNMRVTQEKSFSSSINAAEIKTILRNHPTVPPVAVDLLWQCFEQSSDCASVLCVRNHTFFDDPESFHQGETHEGQSLHLPAFRPAKAKAATALPEEDGITVTFRTDDNSIDMFVKTNHPERIKNVCDALWSADWDLPVHVKVLVDRQFSGDDGPSCELLKGQYLHQLSDVIIGLTITLDSSFNTELDVLGHVTCLSNLLYIDFVNCRDIIVGEDSFKLFHVLRSIRFLETTVQGFQKDAFFNLPSLRHVNLCVRSSSAADKGWMAYERYLKNNKDLQDLFRAKPELLSEKSKGQVWKIQDRYESSEMVEDAFFYL